MSHEGQPRPTIHEAYPPSSALEAYVVPPDRKGGTLFEVTLDGFPFAELRIKHHWKTLTFEGSADFTEPEQELIYSLGKALDPKGRPRNMSAVLVLRNKRNGIHQTESELGNKRTKHYKDAMKHPLRIVKASYDVDLPSFHYRVVAQNPAMNVGVGYVRIKIPTDGDFSPQTIAWVAGHHNYAIDIPPFDYAASAAVLSNLR